MRIDKNFVDFLKQQVLSLDSQAHLFLFGSRTKDHLRGGDIDLLILSDFITFSQKLDLLIQLKTRFGDQKIDITLCPHAHKRSDPFVSEVLKDAVEL